MQECLEGFVWDKKRKFPQIGKQANWICPSCHDLRTRNSAVYEGRLVKYIGRGPSAAILQVLVSLY
jgi:hypothetical protein